MTATEKLGDATYSPEDDKLRLYFATRLPQEDYDRLRSHGFTWAPKQELFVAVWTPTRETIAEELCGEIGDEDTSLVERAEVRAERFQEYSSSRESDGDQAYKAAHAIMDNIPPGQPILIGHHSEKRARRDREKIDSAMGKAVKMWETAEYWERRARGALSHAKYKDMPAVRARRIKKLEADARKYTKRRADSVKLAAMWDEIDSKPEELRERFAICICNLYDHYSKCFPLAEFPRLRENASQYEGTMSLWSAITGGVITWQQARDISRKGRAWIIPDCDRWLTHLANRIAYERAMLGESGGLATDKTKPEKGGAVRISYLSQSLCEVVKVNRTTITVLHRWPSDPCPHLAKIAFDKVTEVLSPADYQSIKHRYEPREEPISAIVKTA